MSTVTIPMDNVELDIDGKVIKAPLLDIYYVMVNSTTTMETADGKVKMEAMANAVNSEYDCNISWGQAAHLLSALDEKIKDLKKNTTQEQE